MAVTCPECGEEAESNRFYCGSCGHELRRTDLPGDVKRGPVTKVRDIDSRAITIALVGIAICIVGLMAYTIGAYSGVYTGADSWFGWSGMILTLGFCMIGVGVFMNWSQELPKSVRFAIGSEVVFGAIGLTVCLALIMQVTSWEWITSETGQRLYKVPVYDNRATMIPMLVPLVLCPFLLVFGLWLASRLAWVVAVLFSFIGIALVATELPHRAGNAIPAVMVGVQVVFLLALMTPSVRAFFLKSSKAKNASSGP